MNRAWLARRTLPPARTLAECDRRLARYLREDLVPCSPYYTRLFRDRGLSLNGRWNLADLPFTTKEDVIAATTANPLAFVLKPDAAVIRGHWPLARQLPLVGRRLFQGEAAMRRTLEREFLPIFMTATTGRAAQPISFLYARSDMDRLAEVGARMAAIIGLGAADRCINLFPYAPHLAFWQVMFSGYEAGVFMLSTGGGKTIGTGGNLRALERVRPTCILGVPGYVYHLLREAEERGIRLPDLRIIVLGAEKIPPGLRRKLIDAVVRMGGQPPRVVGTFGFTEARMAWIECSEGSGYHLYHDMERIEIVDPATGRPVAPGETGEIVYTTLGGRGTSVLRYRTGDIAEGGLTHAPCPGCGFTLPRLSSGITRLSNRKDFQLTKVKGTLVDLNHVAAILGEMHEIEEWQVEIAKVNDDPSEVDSLVLHLAAAPGRTLDVQAIARRIFEATEISLNNVKVASLEEMVVRLGLESEMKEKRFIDRRQS